MASAGWRQALGNRCPAVRPGRDSPLQLRGGSGRRARVLGATGIPPGNTKPEFQAAALTWGWPKWADLFSISSLTFVLISPGSSPSLPDLKKGRGRRCRLPRAPERARLSSPVQASPRLRAGDWGSPKPRSKDALFVWNGLLKTRTHTITKPVWFREAVRGSHDPV